LRDARTRVFEVWRKQLGKAITRDLVHYLFLIRRNGKKLLPAMRFLASSTGRFPTVLDEWRAAVAALSAEGSAI
jgi:hypothetical protein